MFTRSLKLGHLACVSETVLGKSRSFYSAVKKDSPRILITGKTREKLLITTFPALCTVAYYGSFSTSVLSSKPFMLLCWLFVEQKLRYASVTNTNLSLEGFRLSVKRKKKLR